MYLLVTARKGISSLQLAKEIGITQKSAWFVLHRLREACSTPEVVAKLKGIVCEVDRMKTPKELDAVVDAVLAYKPKPKTKAAKRRVRKAKRESKKKG